LSQIIDTLVALSAAATPADAILGYRDDRATDSNLFRQTKTAINFRLPDKKFKSSRFFLKLLLFTT